MQKTAAGANAEDLTPPKKAVQGVDRDKENIDTNRLKMFCDRGCFNKSNWVPLFQRELSIEYP